MKRRLEKRKKMKTSHELLRDVITFVDENLGKKFVVKGEISVEKQ